MKVRVKIWYPYVATHKEEIEIDVPDGKDAEDYVYENEEKILEENGAEFDFCALATALDLEYAGARVLKPAAAEKEGSK